MATRTCPDCSTQYLATVRRCIDCDVLLVDDPVGPDAVAELSEVDDHGDGHGTIRMTLESWGNQLKITLDGMLQRRGIPHVWEAGDLVVSERFRSDLEELLASVEGREIDAGPAGREAPTGELVSLDIEGLDADVRDRLDGLLMAADVEHAWGEDGGLVISTADETVVLELIDRAFETDGGADAVGAEPQSVLTDLFVATDRLSRRIGDPRSEAEYRDAADAVQDCPIPYGFDPPAWDDLVATARTLVHSAEDDPERTVGDGTGDALGEEARAVGLAELRERLREIV